MAYRLRVIQGPGVGSELELDEGDSTIGRAPENALVINDSNVSRVHARFRAQGNRVAVMDAGSRNGVYVNDRRLELEELQPIAPGDRVVIGQSILELAANAPAARPRTGAVAARAPAAGPAPRGNGGGAVAAVRPPVPATRPGAVPQRATAAGAVARTGGAAKAKAQGGALPKPLLFGVVGAGVLLIGAMVMFGGSTSGPTTTGGGNVGTIATPVIPPLPAGIVGSGGQSEDKCNPQCQHHLDVGDSQRDGGNLPAARTSFQKAVDAEPTCASCVIRLEAVERSIEEKIRLYEKSGILSFEKGDFPRAIDSWKIAMELMPDPKLLRDATKKMQWEARRNGLRKKIDEADKLVERQPQ